jgi:hypothetical protein
MAELLYSLKREMLKEAVKEWQDIDVLDFTVEEDLLILWFNVGKNTKCLVKDIPEVYKIAQSIRSCTDMIR